MPCPHKFYVDIFTIIQYTSGSLNLEFNSDDCKTGN